jgi:hypothetical protein
MSAFLKTLVGDRDTVAVVMVIMAAEGVLAATNQLGAAVLAVPLLVLAGVAWLAGR